MLKRWSTKLHWYQRDLMRIDFVHWGGCITWNSNIKGTSFCKLAAGSLVSSPMIHKQIRCIPSWQNGCKGACNHKLDDDKGILQVSRWWLGLIYTNT